MCDTDDRLIGQDISAFYGAREFPISSKQAHSGEGGKYENYFEILIL